MGIINTQPSFPPTPEQFLQLQADAYKLSLNNQYQQNTRLAESLTHFVWSDPTKAQDRLNLFGPDAADLLKISAAFTALVSTYTGSSPQIIPSGYSLTPNSDGSVTVTTVH